MKRFETFVNEPDSRFRSSHSSTVCELANRDLYAVWFTGSVEGAEDTVVAGSCFSMSNRTWSSPAVIVDVPEHAAGNPRVFRGPFGELWLLFAINYGRWCHGGSRLFLKRSYDEGRTWSDMSIFWDEGGLLGKNKPIHLRSRPSAWIVPVEWEDDYVCAFLRTEDYGRSWDLVGDLGRMSGVRVDQPTIVELSGDGRLLAYMRSWEGHIYESRSGDFGATWSEPTATELPNNNSGIDMVRLSNGDLVLAHNPTALGSDGTYVVDQRLKSNPEFAVSPSEFAKDKNGYRSRTPEISALFPQWGPRTPLRLSVSRDQGETWTPALDLQLGDGEFSYPSIIQLSDRRICVTYTFNRTYIRHVMLSEEALME